MNYRHIIIVANVVIMALIIGFSIRFTYGMMDGMTFCETVDWKTRLYVQIVRFKDFYFAYLLLFLMTLFVTKKTYRNAKQVETISGEVGRILWKPTWEIISFAVVASIHLALALVILFVVYQERLSWRAYLFAHLVMKCLLTSAILNLYHLKRK